MLLWPYFQGDTHICGVLFLCTLGPVFGDCPSGQRKVIKDEILFYCVQS